MWLCWVTGLYGDIPIGLYIVRGDSVVLLGEVDPEREAAAEGLTKVSAEVRHTRRRRACPGLWGGRRVSAKACCLCVCVGAWWCIQEILEAQQTAGGASASKTEWEIE